MSLSYSYPASTFRSCPSAPTPITPRNLHRAFVGSPTLENNELHTAISAFQLHRLRDLLRRPLHQRPGQSDVAQAVYAFFLNGGNNAYVVGLQPEAYAGIAPLGQIRNWANQYQSRPRSLLPVPVRHTAFTRSNPAIRPMTATYHQPARLQPPSPRRLRQFDLIIIMAPRIEVYRSVNTQSPRARAGSLDKLIKRTFRTLVQSSP